MGETSPLKLDAAAIDRCASIVTVPRRDIFDPVLVKLVTGACRRAKDALQSAAIRKDRAKIKRTGRIFAKALSDAHPEAKWEFVIGLPYGTTWLSVTLDAMGPSPRSSRDRARQFITLVGLH